MKGIWSLAWLPGCAFAARVAVATFALMGLFLSGCASRGRAPGPQAATAELRKADGQDAGSATLTQSDGGVRIELDVRGLAPGAKGVHIHEVGACQPPDFKSAGDHFNPERRKHGTLNPEGPHAGDLPNITIAEDGSGRLEVMTARVTLDEGSTSLFDADGSALVVHAGPDDMQTDPAGNSGDRIACGTIQRR